MKYTGGLTRSQTRTLCCAPIMVSLKTNPPMDIMLLRTTCFGICAVSDIHFICRVGHTCGGYCAATRDCLQCGDLAKLIDLGGSILEAECLFRDSCTNIACRKIHHLLISSYITTVHPCYQTIVHSRMQVCGHV